MTHSTAKFEQYKYNKAAQRGEIGKPKFPEIGDKVIGLFRLDTDPLPPFHTRRHGALDSKSEVAAVYSATRVRVKSGDVFDVQYIGNDTYKAVFLGRYK